ncbi:MAG TPA: radical SAM protein [Thermotogaceae bacterium]|nr:radical SAM protein [Thermotogaceae bacterium]
MNCKHCGKHYLKHMMWMEEISPSSLNGKYNSILISGGVNSKLKVPIEGFLDRIIEFRKSGYRLNLHVGILTDDDNLEFLKYADAVSLDFVGDEKVINEVYGLNISVREYLKTIEIVRKYIEPSIHLTVGLQCGRITHEYKALEMLRELGFDKLIMNIFIPTLGTAYQNCFPPDFDDVKQVFQKARLYFPKLILGCMQPRGTYRVMLQRLAFDIGFDVITKPVQNTYKYIKKEGYEFSDHQECCAFII